VTNQAVCHKFVAQASQFLDRSYKKTPAEAGGK
jgi:hypothetical protein